MPKNLNQQYSVIWWFWPVTIRRFVLMRDLVCLLAYRTLVDRNGSQTRHHDPVPCLTQASPLNWLRGLDSNQRPLAYETSEIDLTSLPRNYFKFALMVAYHQNWLGLVNPIDDQSTDSHRPVERYDHSHFNSPTVLPLQGQSRRPNMVLLAGFEPTTKALSRLCSTN